MNSDKRYLGAYLLQTWGVGVAEICFSLNQGGFHRIQRRTQDQDDGKGGLSLRGVAVTSGTATTAKTVKTVTVVSLHCIL